MATRVFCVSDVCRYANEAMRMLGVLGYDRRSAHSHAQYSKELRVAVEDHCKSLQEAIAPPTPEDSSVPPSTVTDSRRKPKVVCTPHIVQELFAMVDEAHHAGNYARIFPPATAHGCGAYCAFFAPTRRRQQRAPAADAERGATPEDRITWSFLREFGGLLPRRVSIPELKSGKKLRTTRNAPIAMHAEDEAQNDDGLAHTIRYDS